MSPALDGHPAGVLGFLPPVERLIRSNPVHGTSTLGSVLQSVSTVFTIARHSLNANRAAPACRASTSCCSTVGSRQKRNVVCRVIAASIPQPTDNHWPAVEVSDRVINVGGYVTLSRRCGVDDAMTPIYRTRAWAGIARFVVPEHLP